MAFSRADRSVLAEWWFTVDRTLLGAVLILLGIGVILSLAASPGIAARKELPTFYFVERHLVFAGLAAAVMISVSLLTPRLIRRMSLAILIVAAALMIAVLGWGEEINGARRWVRIAGFSLQPSELAKPAFVVISAWAFAEVERKTDMPALAIALGSYAAFVVLLVQQPDIGQALLVTAVWGALFLLSGQPLIRVAGLAAAAGAACLAAYATVAHVRVRVDHFLGGLPGDRSQADRARQSFIEGGFWGRGPAEGTIKTVLPDAHTDFILAVVAEEYGIVATLLLLALFAFVVFRAMLRAVGEPDAFRRNAVMGLSLAFGLQALINMAVNVGLVPVKGMTLPLVSAGGSSMLAVAVTLGMILALGRRRADPLRLKMPRLGEKRGASAASTGTAGASPR